MQDVLIKTDYYTNWVIWDVLIEPTYCANEVVVEIMGQDRVWQGA